MPRPVDALPCGSRSMISTCSLMAASAVPRLIAVVVLPTPPFWLATASTRGALAFCTGAARSCSRSSTSASPEVDDWVSVIALPIGHWTIGRGPISQGCWDRVDFAEPLTLNPNHLASPRSSLPLQAPLQSPDRNDAGLGIGAAWDQSGRN